MQNLKKFFLAISEFRLPTSKTDPERKYVHKSRITGKRREKSESI